MARRSNIFRGSGRRRTFAAGALVSRDAFRVLSGVSERELAIWERENLLAPARVVEHNGRREPLYAPQTLRRAQIIRTLAEDLEVNLPGIDIILNLLDRMNR
ncbi:MAG TPA: chaperone modulator CbpM [Candidatus Binataceae bacterium]|jgi:DNA-binding transcriptional MerR regulator|nr:chaperone modulator CbpM [Candidatus Binataceae bacterium]